MLRPFILALLSFCLFACGAAPDESPGQITQADLRQVTTHMNVRIGTHIPAGVVDGCINMSADPNNDTIVLGVSACYDQSPPIEDSAFYRLTYPYRIFSSITPAEWNALVTMLNTPGVQTVCTFTFTLQESPYSPNPYDKTVLAISFSTIPIP